MGDVHVFVWKIVSVIGKRPLQVAEIVVDQLVNVVDDGQGGCWLFLDSFVHSFQIQTTTKLLDADKANLNGAVFGGLEHVDRDSLISREKFGCITE